MQMITALFWAITQRIVVISYRRFGTTYRSHVIKDQESKKPRREQFSYSVALNIEAGRFPEALEETPTRVVGTRNFL
jgi:hypothetical protein